MLTSGMVEQIELRVLLQELLLDVQLIDLFYVVLLRCCSALTVPNSFVLSSIVPFAYLNLILEVSLKLI